MVKQEDLDEDELEAERAKWIRDAFRNLCGPAVAQKAPPKKEEHDASGSDDSPQSGDKACPRLTSKRVRGRCFVEWVRSFLTDMRCQGSLRPAQDVRTTRLINLLATRAETNEAKGLTSAEFAAFAQVLMHPSPGYAVEEEVSWALLDVERKGEVSISLMPQLEKLWKSLGVVCCPQDIEQLVATVRDLENEMLSAERFHELYLASSADTTKWRPSHGRPPTLGCISTSARLPAEAAGWKINTSSAPPSAAASPSSTARSGFRAPNSARNTARPSSQGQREVSTAPLPTQRASSSGPGRIAVKPGSAPGIPRSTFVMTPTLRGGDAVVRSREVREVALQPESSDNVSRACKLNQHGIRPLSPSRTTPRVLPKATQKKLEEEAQAAQALAAASDKEVQVKKKQTTTKARKALDWEQEEALWAKRQERLKPYQRVEVQYIGPGGAKVKAQGVLVRGWRQPNKACELPHSKPPESCAKSQELRLSKEPTKSPKSWELEVDKVNDEDNYAVVEVNGIGKVVPREWVKPLPSTTETGGKRSV